MHIRQASQSRVNAHNGASGQLLKNGTCFLDQQRPLSLRPYPFADPILLRETAKVIASAVVQCCPTRKDHGVYLEQTAMNRRRIERDLLRITREVRAKSQMKAFWKKRDRQIQESSDALLEVAA